MDRKSIPVLPGTVWQADVRPFPVPGMQFDSEDESQLPQVILFVDSANRWLGKPHVVAPDADIAEEFMAQFVKQAKAHSAKSLPQTLQLCRPELAEALRSRVAELGVQIELVPTLSLVDEVLEFMREAAAEDGVPGNSFFDDSTSVDGLIAFSLAVLELEKRSWWKILHDDDLVEVLSPPAPAKNLRCTSVMGAAGQQYGLAFFADEAAMEQFCNNAMDGDKLTRNTYALMFQSLDDLPNRERKFVQEHGIPVSRELGIPLLWHYQKGELARATPEELAYVEGLSLALAQTSQEEFDSGAWEKTVATSKGDVKYQLRVPSLRRYHQGIAPKQKRLEPGSRWMDYQSLMVGRLMSAQNFTSMDDANEFLRRNVMGKTLDQWRLPPANTKEQAEQLAYEALDASSRVAVIMAKQAISLDPDCCEAYLLLAENAADRVDKMTYLGQAIGAGERTLSERGVFEEKKYPFWSDASTRPYMRAMFDLAHLLFASRERDKALPYYQKLLKLNPGDNLGVRYEYARALLTCGMLDQLDALLNSPHYRHDDAAEWMFVKALLAFRRQAPDATATLQHAMRSNRHVAGYVLGERELPPFNPSCYSPGSEDEAILIAPELRRPFEEAPGALAWLARIRKATKPRSIAKGQRRK